MDTDGHRSVAGIPDTESDVFHEDCHPDDWQVKRFTDMGHPAPHWREDGSCSHCGGMRPSIALLELESGAELVPTDKAYKLYIEGAKHPSRGAWKVYTRHFSQSQALKLVQLVEEKRIKIAFPGHLYSGLAFGRYKEVIQQWLKERSPRVEPPVSGTEH